MTYLVTVTGPMGERQDYRLCRDCFTDWKSKDGAMAPGFVMAWQEFAGDLGCEYCEVGLSMKAQAERKRRMEYEREDVPAN